MRTWRDSGPEERLEGKASCFRVIPRFFSLQFFVGSPLSFEKAIERQKMRFLRALLSTIGWRRFSSILDVNDASGAEKLSEQS